MLKQKLDLIRSQINAAEQKYNRAPGSVILLAVSKGHGADLIAQMAGCGQVAFGESYVQEAIKKIQELADLHLEWHFIGKIQSNKAKLIAQHFSWVQSITRIDIAKMLSKYRSENLQPLNVCIEVNLSNEPSKGGVMLQDVLPLAQEIIKQPNLKLRGLMAIPASTSDFTKQLETFSILKQEFDKLNSAGFKLDTLSMGMSDDFEAAIAAGSTMVRIGTAIFGERISRLS